MGAHDKPAFGIMRPDRHRRRADDRKPGVKAKRTRRLVFSAAVMITAAAIVVVWLLLARGSTGADDLLSDVHPAWTEIAAELPLDPTRRYSDEELGLYDLIDDVIDESPAYVRFRTVEDYHASQDERSERIYLLASGHERERLIFESEVESVIHTAYGFLPPDLGAGGRLEQAFVEAMRACASAAGYPDINPMGGSDEEYARWEAEYGLTLDGLLDLRHECAQQAASYPTLDSEVRDEMLNRMRKHYLQAVHDYLRQDDVVEIAIEHA